MRQQVGTAVGHRYLRGTAAAGDTRQKAIAYRLRLALAL